MRIMWNILKCGLKAGNVLPAKAFLAEVAESFSSLEQSALQ
jgi:hypothetical protein